MAPLIFKQHADVIYSGVLLLFSVIAAAIAVFRFCSVYKQDHRKREGMRTQLLLGYRMFSLEDYLIYFIA